MKLRIKESGFVDRGYSDAFNRGYERPSKSYDLEKLMFEFGEEYEYLYNVDAYVAGYDEAVDFFDNAMEDDAEVKKLVIDFVKYRQDAISSDREAAAFVFACDKLGYI